MTDEAFAIDILPRVSRTFALSIEALPEPLRGAIRVSYLLCRVVDTIEDDPDLAAEERQKLFSEFERVVGDDSASYSALEEAFAPWTGSDDHELCRNVGAVLRIFRSLDEALAEAARPHVIEMTRGMAEYSARWRGPGALTVLEDREDLERYCFYVAGTVGNLLTGLFIATHPELPEALRRGLERRSVSFGLGLQMTNIVKDVTDDQARGWCFLPRSLCNAQGVAPEELLAPDKRDEAMAVVRQVIDLAQSKLDEALEYTLLLPKEAAEVRLFVLVPLALALSTLSLVRGTPEVLDRGHDVKVSRATVAATLSEASRVVSDNEGVRELCRRAAEMAL